MTDTAELSVAFIPVNAPKQDASTAHVHTLNGHLHTQSGHLLTHKLHICSAKADNYRSPMDICSLKVDIYRSQVDTSARQNRITINEKACFSETHVSENHVP